MNNRIIPLIEKAGFLNKDEESIKYFANLLLAECLDVVRNTPRHCARTTYDLDTVECTIEDSVRAIKDHFGV